MFQNFTNKIIMAGNSIKIWTMVVFLFASCTFAGEKGGIEGTVVSDENGEVLIGVNVVVTGTSWGATTDLDGTYRIKNLTPGKYTLRFSCISFQTSTIKDIEVKEGTVIKVDAFLRPSTHEISEVVISADMLKSNENAMLKIQKNSLNIMDAVSAELIKKNNSSSGTDVLKRMTGVTISEGKFAFIRGVSDRYNNTMLNGANLPSTDPEKKSFSYDIFPSSLIENVMTAKTATPDKPADFSGGLVQINTVEFPDKFFLELSAGTSLNSQTTGRNFFTYKGGNTDYLGVDDGTRSKPSALNRDLSKLNYDPALNQEVGRSFSNNWNTKTTTAPVNSNYKLSFGDRYETGAGMLGLIGAITYSNNFETKEFKKNYYYYDGPHYNYSGTNYNKSVLWGAMLNFSYKFGQNHKISFKNIYNQNSDDDVVITQGNHYYVPEYRKVTSMKFLSRSLYSAQLIGEHAIALLNNSTVNWNLSYGRSERNEPDGRKYFYSRDIDSSDSALRFALNQAITTRFYSELEDNIYGGSADFNIKPFENPAMPTFKIGMLYDRKQREFDARLFGFDFNKKYSIALRDSIFSLDAESVLREENINKQFIQVYEITKPTDSYKSHQTVLSTYIMFNMSVIENLRLLGGLRYEKSKVELTSKESNGGLLKTTPENDDLLPSFNLTYIPVQQINIRAAYSRTLARPEFRELAPFSYYDFLSDESVMGYSGLKRSLIDNYDFRVEYFQGRGELIAVSLFYKHFTDPIEQVLIAASGDPVRSYRNADRAKNYGVEFELRQSLGNYMPALRDFSFVGNVSLIKSRIILTMTDNQGTIKDDRPLQGQSDYVINAGLYYENSALGLNGSISYNKIGWQLNKVGFNGIGDIYEKPRDQVDISLGKKLFQDLSLKLVVRDILAQDQEFIQKHPDGDKTADVYKKGRVISFGLSYTF